MEEEALKAIAAIIKAGPSAVQAAKGLRRGGDVGNAIVDALQAKLAEVVDETDVRVLAERIQKKDDYRKLRKQINGEACLQLALELAAERLPESQRPIEEDWFNQWFEAAESVSDQRLQQLWARAFANQFDAAARPISPRALETLRLMTYSDVCDLARFGDFIDRFGFLCCRSHLVMGSVLGEDAMENLLDLQAIRREETHVLAVPLDTAWTLHWRLPTGSVQPDPTPTVVLSARGKELVSTMPAEIRRAAGADRSLDLEDEFVTIQYANLLVADAGPGDQRILSWNEMRATHPNDPAAQRSRDSIETHQWDPEQAQWVRLLDEVPAAIAKFVSELESGSRRP